MNTSVRLFLFAGEHSGDLHGSHLMKRLKERNLPLHISGVGGPLMRSQGMDCLYPMEEFAVMGFSDVLSSLPKLVQRFYSIRHAILTKPPAVLVLIDYPGFNLRLAHSLRKRGFQGRILHYISPSIWAHGKKRRDVMCQSLDLLLTIYPFEASYFEDTSLKVEYVGNPLWEYIQLHTYDELWKKTLGIPESAPLLALFPGSRAGEIKRNFLPMFQAALQLKQHHSEIILLISEAHPEARRLVQEAVVDSPLRLGRDLFLVPPSFTYEMMRASRCAIAKSGTVTLELALHACPSVVIYKLTLLNRWIAQYCLRLNLPYYCIVNILANSFVFPELIEREFSATDIFQELLPLFTEGEERRRCLMACQEITALLKTRPASERAAELVEELLCR
jgi:lipid-A-disaccharide synthase